jgi:hydrogenase-4 component E
VTLVNLLAIQGALLFVATLLLAWRTGERHLYLSAGLTLALKVAAAVAAAPAHPPPPGLLGHRAAAEHLGHDARGPPRRRLRLWLAQPIAALASTATRSAIGIAVAVILLSFVTMITRRKAMSQVVGFLSMENGLFFGAMSATYGMPMIVEFESRSMCWSPCWSSASFSFRSVSSSTVLTCTISNP